MTTMPPKLTHVLNLTPTDATPDQVTAGAVELDHETRAEVLRLHAWEAIPDSLEIHQRAERLAKIAEAWAGRVDPENQLVLGAMVGGAPGLVAALEDRLTCYEVEPVYSFALPEVVVEVRLGGAVREERTVLRHAGWVRPEVD